jgi:phosphate-selective porin OprO/OprP
MSISNNGTRPWAWAAAVAATLTLGTAARADETSPAPQPEQAVALAPETVAAPSGGTAAAVQAPTPPPGEKSSEQRLRELEDTVRKLQDEISRLRAQSEKPVDPKQVEKVVDDRLKKQKPTAGWNNGFFLQSEDGDFKLRLRALIHADSRAFTSSKGFTGTDTFYLRRVRPIIEGTLYKYFDFRITPDFGEGRTVLQDAYLDVNLRPELRLRGGKSKEPFSLERLQSAADLHFIERSIANNLAPNRDVGVQLFGDVLKGTVTYQLGAYNGTPDGGSLDTDPGNDKDFVGRVFAQPFRNQEKSPFRELGVGFAATIGQRDETFTSVSDRTTGRSTFFHYASNTNGNGTLLRLSPQFYYFHGPFGLMGEYLTNRQELVRGANEGETTNHGGFLQATYVLTGEKSTYRGLVPNKPFDPKKNQWGAFEVGVRYSHVDFDDANYRLGFASRTDSVSDANAWTVGLNWYLNRTFKLQLNYERTDFDHAIQLGSQRFDHEDVFLSRFQVAF